MKQITQFASPLRQYRTYTAYLVIHHAAKVYPAGKALESIYTYHKQKWPDFGGLGYHIVLQEEVKGNIEAYQVNELDLYAAHTLGHNGSSLGICIADDCSEQLHRKWYEPLLSVLVEQSKRYPNALIVGHQDLVETTCPGAWFVGQKEQIRAEVLKRKQETVEWGSEFPFHEGWAIPRYWTEHKQRLGPPTTLENYLNAFQSVQGFKNGLLIYNNQTKKVKEVQ